MSAWEVVVVAEAEAVVVPESAAEAALEAAASLALQEGCRLFLSYIYPSQYALFGVSAPSAICQGLALVWAGTEVVRVVVVRGASLSSSVSVQTL